MVRFGKKKGKKDDLKTIHKPMNVGTDPDFINIPGLNKDVKKLDTRKKSILVDDLDDQKSVEYYGDEEVIPGHIQPNIPSFINIPGHPELDPTHKTTIPKIKHKEDDDPADKIQNPGLISKFYSIKHRPSIFQMVLITLLVVSIPIHEYMFIGILIILGITALIPLLLMGKAHIIKHRKMEEDKKQRKLLLEKDVEISTLLTYADFVFKFKFIDRIRSILKIKIRAGILEGGVSGNSDYLAKKSIVYAIIGYLIMIPASIIIAVFLNPLFIFLAFSPTIMFAFGILSTSSAKGQRKSSIEHELPIFVACTTIMANVNITLYGFMEKVAKSKTSLFPVLKEEINKIHKKRTFMGQSDQEALAELSKTHPSESFKEFVHNYTIAVDNSTTNTQNLLGTMTANAFRAMKKQISAYAVDAQSILQMVLLVMAVMPIIALATTFVSTGKDSVSMVVMIIFLIPIISIVIIFMINSKQPKTNIDIKIKYTGIIIGVVASIVLFVVGLELHVVVGIAVAVACTINAYQVRSHFSNVEAIDEKLPEFLQSISSSNTEGIPVDKAIKKRVSTEKEGPFADMLIKISAQVVQGEKLSECTEKVKTKSWLAKIVFFVLGQIQDAGGGSAETLNIFADMINEFQQAKHELIASLKSSIMMGYFIPILMIMMVIMAQQMTNNVNVDLTEVQGLPISFPSAEAAKQIESQSFFLIVVACICIGMIISKIAFFTLYHTKHVAILSVMGVIATYLVPHVPQII